MPAVQRRCRKVHEDGVVPRSQQGIVVVSPLVQRSRTSVWWTVNTERFLPCPVRTGKPKRLYTWSGDCTRKPYKARDETICSGLFFLLFLVRTSGDRPAGGTSPVAQATDQVIVLSLYFAYPLAALFSFFHVSALLHCVTASRRLNSAPTTWLSTTKVHKWLA